MADITTTGDLMIVATLVGNIGQAAESKQVGDGTVTAWTVASNTRGRDGETTTWVRCSLWGRRGEALRQYLTAGKRVTVIGQLTVREHEGRTYHDLRVDHVEFGNNKSDAAPPTKKQTAPQKDDIPF